LYKTTDYWVAQYERTLAWDDPVLAIDWPLQGAPVLSPKDAMGVPLARAETYP
jgi:dTDP-4-dehydrorhamnose 3,5-epimerase